MTEQNLPAVALDLPLPATVPTRPFDDLAQRLRSIDYSLFEHAFNPERSLRDAIPVAEALLVECAAQADQLRDAMEPMPREELKRAVAAFLAAWPNVSHGDIAGFGAQLMGDLIERKPCRRAVREGFRELRHTSRFLPSIAEVLVVTDKAQSQVRNASAIVARLPARIEAGRSRLAREDRIEAERVQRLAAAKARREADGKSTERCETTA